MSPQEWQPSRRARHRLRGKSGPVTTGWATVTGASIVVAVFEGESLPHALAKLHGAGYGGMARVLDASRGDVNLQLHRLGIDNDLGLSYADPSSRILVVRAAARSQNLGDLLLASGATDVRIVTPGRTSDPSADPEEGAQATDDQAGESI